MKTFYKKKDPYSEEVVYVNYETWDKRLDSIFDEYSTSTHFQGKDMVEYGASLHFPSPFSSNVKNIFDAIGISGVLRVERTTRIMRTHFKEDMVDPIVDVIFEEKITSFDVHDVLPLENEIIPIDDIHAFGKKHGLAFDHDDIEYYTRLFRDKIGRDPTSTELYDLSQGNSEHSRHWFFTGKMCIDGVLKEKSLLKKIKEPLEHIRKVSKTHDVSLVAFRDNASAIKNYITTMNLVPSSYVIGSKYIKTYNLYHPTLTAETHNFPTGVAPFQGAETGVGGRIRDTQAIGKGGIPLCGLAGYCVADFKSSGGKHSAVDILYKASDGASDYGNKFGEPLVLGFCRSFGDNIGEEHREWYKPIMFSAGIGLVHNSTYLKDKAEIGLLIVKLGGPAYRIGIGGGSASSRSGAQGDTDLSAVQRGDAEMENRLNRVIRSLVELGDRNPIRSIHDQGAGGTSNVTKEIIEPYGSVIDIDRVVRGDETMTPMEIWIAEYQEQNTILIDEKHIDYVKTVCERERVPIAVIGKIMDRPNVTVKSSRVSGEGISPEEGDVILDLPIRDVLSDIQRKTYELTSLNYERSYDKLGLTTGFRSYVKKVLGLPSVGSKHFLTSKVDRSVGGLVVRGQCVGPFHTPLSNFAITATSFLETVGTVTSIGEAPLKGFHNPRNMVNMAIGEMLTNMMGAYIGNVNGIRCSGNWMWANDDNRNKMMLNDAVDEVRKTMIKLGIAIDGGKDSLSMSQNIDGERVRSPNQFVITGYSTMRNVMNHITPEFKGAGNHIVYIDLGYNNHRVGGSALCQVLGEYNYESPNFEKIERFGGVFSIIQILLLNGHIYSLHDRSDGGLITTLMEMCIGSNLGADINIVTKTDPFHYFFAEELGLIVEARNFETIDKLLGHMVPVYKIGVVKEEPKVNITFNTLDIFEMDISEARVDWEETSFNVLERMTDLKCVTAERDYVSNPVNYATYPQYKSPFDWFYIENTSLKYNYTVGIIREEGSNGDREMAFAFHDAGFNVYDLNMRDLVKRPSILNTLRGIVFVGGFSYADALGAGTGWAASIQSNPRLCEAFTNFRDREDTFSLGVCNGCQLMSKLGWIEGKLVRNDSGRFESRYSTVRIGRTKSVLLQGMEGGILGVWVAHGEGKFTGLKTADVPVYYTDNSGKRTGDYPLNPNGSERSAAAVCSADGRHLAMMPHPERCVLNRQNPYVPPRWSKNKYYPWRRLFLNAYDFCDGI